MVAYTVVRTPVGEITIFEDDGAIVALDWGRAPDPADTPLLLEARDQVLAYFDQKLEAFDLPLAPKGTDHQNRVWSAMQNIPFGETRSYGDLAAQIGSSARAVGGACGANPIPIIIPCHRVLAANKKLGGYSGGAGSETKTILLRIEGLVLT